MKKLSDLAKSKKFKQALELALFRGRISTHVYETRKKIGLTQTELAKKAGTSQRIISDVETGNYKMAEMLYRLFRVLNKELVSDGEDLITGKEIKSSCKIFIANASDDVSDEYSFGTVLENIENTDCLANQSVLNKTKVAFAMPSFDKMKLN